MKGEPRELILLPPSTPEGPGSNPDSLRGNFRWYRALDTTIAQDEQRKSRRLTMPVLAIGGEASFGENVGNAVQAVADEVQSVVIPGIGHFVAAYRDGA